jgi:CRP-like cAMP-binding protein
MIDRDWHRSMVVSRTPLFTGLEEAALEDVLSCSRSRRYTAGQLICREGDASSSVFLLCRGVVTAFVTSVTSSRVATVARLRPGDVIGEVGFITNLPRSASVIARSDAELLEIAREDFARLLVRHPELLANITQLLAERLAKETPICAIAAPGRLSSSLSESGWRPRQRVSSRRRVVRAPTALPPST